MYAAAVDYIQANQFSISTTEIIEGVINFIISVVASIYGIASNNIPFILETLSSLDSCVSALADLINGFDAIKEDKTIDEFEDTFLTIKRTIIERQPGDIICIRNNAIVTDEYVYDHSTQQFGYYYYFKIIPFRCHDDTYFDRNPVKLTSNLISNYIPADEFNTMSNYGSLTLLKETDLEKYMQETSGDMYIELTQHLEERYKEAINK